MPATYITLNKPLIWPGNTINHAGAAPSIGNLDTLDGNGGPGATPDATAFVISAPRDLAISHVALRPSVVATSPTARVEIQTVDPATGFPTGTLWATSTSGVSAVLTTTIVTVALTATATIAKGQIFAVVFMWNSVGSYTLGSVINTSANNISGPYKLTNTTGAWVKSGFPGAQVALGSGATDFYCIDGFFPVNTSISANSFNNASSARRGARFRLPIDCYISGFRIVMGTGIGAYNAMVLNSSNVEVGSSSTFIPGKVTPELAHGPQNLFFDNEIGPLTAGTDYYFAVEPTTTTNCNLYTWPFNGNHFRKAYPGGVDFDYALGTPTMAASDQQVPMLDLLISRIPLGGESGGGTTSQAHMIGV